VGGQILCDIAQYKLALRDLNIALDRDSESVAALKLKGWALQNLGSPYLEEATGVYETALQRELSQVEELYLRANHGRALSLLGEEHRAAMEYRHAIEKGTKLAETRDADVLASLAWCYHGLEQYGESVRLLAPVLSLDRTLVFAQFDLALALLHSDRHRHALREYHLALQLTQATHVLRRRGLLHVALGDLEGAIAKRPRLARLDEVDEARRLLRYIQVNTEKESTKHLKEINDLQAKRD
jgi:tetratricopeptide (TPR) repeat protein